MLHPARLGLAGGILWGLSMWLCTLLALYTGYSKDFLLLFSSLYPGYSISWWGAFVGLLYGFADAFIGLFLFASLYNFLGRRASR